MLGTNMKQTLKSVALGLLLLLTNGSAVYAQDLEKGFKAAQEGDFATALSEWRPLAERGEAIAQQSLGFMYYNGQGVSQDYTEALKWYLLAADQGVAGAQSNLALMYYNGQGVKQD